jgi:hypothetical protein
MMMALNVEIYGKFFSEKCGTGNIQIVTKITIAHNGSFFYY